MSTDTTTTHQTTHERISEQSLLFTRVFDAPVELVFRAHVEADLFGRWTGPRGSAVRIRTFDARTGGEFSYVVVGSREWAFFGSYHEVAGPGRIVHSWEFEGEPGHPTFETLRFVDLGGDRCRLEGTSTFPSPEECQRMSESDFLDGMDEDHSRLDELLATLADR